MMKPIAFVVAAVVLAGCSPRDSELQQFITQVKQEQPGGVAPLPEVKPYEGFFYTDQAMRSPFVPGGSADSSNSGVRPDVKRNRQFLEQFSLDTLSMVGTLRMGARNFGLVRTSDGLVHRVVPGDYLGQNDGRITGIEPSQINVTEIVPDGLGGYMERTATIALNE
jgi:type IV pilus assembly protein PilP